MAQQLRLGSLKLLLQLGGHGLVLLGEPLAQTGLGGHGLHDAAREAAILAARQGLGGEVVDAGVEAVIDEVSEELSGTMPCQFGVSYG